MSFEKAVIIPYELYEKYNTHIISNSLKSSDDILFDKELAPDVKLKLMSQSKHLNLEGVSKHKHPTSINTVQNNIDTFIHNIHPEIKPLAKDILSHLILKNDITWDNTGEVTIRNKLYKNSHIKEILEYVLGKDSGPHPIGGDDFVRYLNNETNIPPAWINIDKDRGRARIKTAITPLKLATRRVSDIEDSDSDENYQSPPEEYEIEKDPEETASHFFTPRAFYREKPRERASRRALISRVSPPNLRSKKRAKKTGHGLKWITL